MRVLVTGAAGFIGYHVAERLCRNGHEVLGVDNLNDYYDPQLKRRRLSLLSVLASFRFQRLDIADRASLAAVFEANRLDAVINLAAQAGVRYSIENPHSYVDSNLVGFVNVLEGCRRSEVPHLLYASSSSVYGLNEKLPFSEGDSVDHPASLYGATKRANELLAHSYSSMYGLPTTGLRFFTVYGPWGRPDMALYMFAESILAGRELVLFNGGDMMRSYTYVDDVVEGITKLLTRLPAGTGSVGVDPASSPAPFNLFNIGCARPVSLRRTIECLEEALGRKAIIRLGPMQPGDVRASAADGTRLTEVVGVTPSVSFEEGIQRFVRWFQNNHRDNGREEARGA